MEEKNKPVYANKRIKHKVTCRYCFHWDRWGKLYPDEMGRIHKVCKEKAEKVIGDNPVCEHFKLNKVFRCSAWGQIRTPKNCIQRHHETIDEDCGRCQQVPVLEDAVRLQLMLGKEGIMDKHVPVLRTRPALGGHLEDPSPECKHVHLEDGFRYVNIVFCAYYCKARCETYLNRNK